MLFEDPTYLIIAFADAFKIIPVGGANFSPSLYLLMVDKNLSKRQRNNYIWLQFGLPIIGAIIYFSEKSDKSLHLKK